MPLKILPKKSWHVLTRENIERVKRDEAEARRAEKEKEDKILLAEREARSTLLRKRACQKLDGSNHSENDKECSILSDLFPSASSEGNAELQREKREEKEKDEKRLGVLTYLGQSALGRDKKSTRPWYVQKSSDLDQSQRLKRKKDLMDPLMVMTEAQRRLSKTSNSSSKSVSERSDWRSSQATGDDIVLRVKPSLDHREDIAETTSAAKKARFSRKVHFEDSGSGSSSKKKRKKSKKYKKDKIKKKAKGPSIEELRKERLKRENESHTKAELLMRTTAV